YGCPIGFHPSPHEIDRLNSLGRGTAVHELHAEDAVTEAVAVHTDSWVSMGQEIEKQARIRSFRSYTVTNEMMAMAAPGAGFYHCLPAYRGLEVAAEVIDGPASHVFVQAHNRMHTARGALAFLMGVS
ncbi:MAG: ornithine carbamoyltransferase, partial [Actinomycetota bacterium]